MQVSDRRRGIVVMSCLGGLWLGLYCLAVIMFSKLLSYKELFPDGVGLGWSVILIGLVVVCLFYPFAISPLGIPLYSFLKLRKLHFPTEEERQEMQKQVILKRLRDALRPASPEEYILLFPDACKSCYGRVFECTETHHEAQNSEHLCCDEWAWPSISTSYRCQRCGIEHNNRISSWTLVGGRPKDWSLGQRRFVIRHTSPNLRRGQAEAVLEWPLSQSPQMRS